MTLLTPIKPKIVIFSIITLTFHIRSSLRLLHFFLKTQMKIDLLDEEK